MKPSELNHEGHDGHEEIRSFVHFETSWFVFFLALLLLTPRVGYAQDKVPVLSPGIHDLTLAQSGAPTIHYALSVPPRYRGEPVPLVLALHFGGNPDGAGRSDSSGRCVSARRTRAHARSMQTTSGGRIRARRR